jgi:hypothetical protein
VNVPGAGANLRPRLEEPEGQMTKPRGSRIRRDETIPYPSSKHYRELRAELSCSSRGSPASPSVRTDSSSCGSRLALPRSSARLEPCTPSPEPRRTPATAAPLRIGVATSLDKNIPRPTTDRLGQAVFTCPRPSAKNAEANVPSGPQKSNEVCGKSEDKIIFSCVGNVVGNIAYYRHILLIFQR